MRGTGWYERVRGHLKNQPEDWDPPAGAGEDRRGPGRKV